MCAVSLISFPMETDNRDIVASLSYSNPMNVDSTGDALEENNGFLPNSVCEVPFSAENLAVAEVTQCEKPLLSSRYSNISESNDDYYCYTDSPKDDGTAAENRVRFDSKVTVGDAQNASDIPSCSGIVAIDHALDLSLPARKCIFKQANKNVILNPAILHFGWKASYFGGGAEHKSDRRSDDIANNENEHICENNERLLSENPSSFSHVSAGVSEVSTNPVSSEHVLGEENSGDATENQTTCSDISDNDCPIDLNQKPKIVYVSVFDYIQDFPIYSQTNFHLVILIQSFFDYMTFCVVSYLIVFIFSNNSNKRAAGVFFK